MLKKFTVVSVALLALLLLAPLAVAGVEHLVAGYSWAGGYTWFGGYTWLGALLGA
jgi:hypothetical protein